MSLKNCLLFQLAKDTHSRLPQGWASDNKVQEVVKIVSDLVHRKIRLVDTVTSQELLDGLKLSDSLFLGPPYLPASRRSVEAEQKIRNFVVLGAEIAGLDLSRRDINTALFCGGKQNRLNSQGLSTDISYLKDVVFAFTDLSGLSCRNTRIDDVLLRNCKLELALFQNYQILSSFCICYDSEQEVSDCVFFCEKPQEHESFKFVLKSVTFKKCVFLGNFEPTELHDVEFKDSWFGTPEHECTIRGTSDTASLVSKWDITESVLANTSFNSVSNATICFKSSEIKNLTLVNCDFLDFRCDAGNSLHRMDLTASTLRNAVLHPAEDDTGQAKYQVVLHGGESGVDQPVLTTIHNPRISGATFEGLIRNLGMITDSDTPENEMSNGFQGSLTNCTFKGDGLSKHFLDLKSRLSLAGVHFEGTPDSLLELKGVDFGNCDFEDVVFQHCRLLNCRFPAERKDGFGTEHKKEDVRILFVDTEIISHKIENADFSYCRFSCSPEFLERVKNRPIRTSAKELDSDEKTIFENTSFKHCTFSFPITRLVFDNCSFENAEFDMDAPEKIDIDESEFSSCSGLSLSGLKIRNTLFSDSEETRSGIALSGSVEFNHCDALECEFRLGEEADVIFEGERKFGLRSVSVLGSETKDEPRMSKWRFFKTSIRGGKYENIHFSSGSFRHSNILICATDHTRPPSDGTLVLSQCMLSGGDSPTFYHMMIEGVRISDSKLERFKIENSLFQGCLGFEDNPNDRDEKEVHVDLVNCYIDTKEFIVNRNPECKYHLHGTLYSSLDLDRSRLKDKGILVVPNVERKSKGSWQFENPLHSEYAGKTLQSLWEGSNAILHVLGHDVYDCLTDGNRADPEEIRDNRILEKLERVRDNLEQGMLKNILLEDSRSTFLSYIKKIEDHASSVLAKSTPTDTPEDVRDVLVDAACATRVRLIKEKASDPALTLFYWLKRAGISESSLKLVHDESETDRIYDKLYCDFICFGNWIRGTYLPKAAKFNEEPRISVLYCDNHVLFRFGGIGVKAPGFEEMRTKELADRLRDWNPMEFLRAYSYTWIERGSDLRVSVVAKVKDRPHRCRFQLEERKWKEVEWRDDEKWCTGFFYEIPMHRYDR